MSRVAVLVAIDVDGCGDLAGLVADLGEACAGVASGWLDGRRCHYLTIDRARMRPTVAHGWACHHGFIAHLDSERDPRWRADDESAPGAMAEVSR